MFKNYHEFFHGCVDFYSVSLFGESSAPDMDLVKRSLLVGHNVFAEQMSNLHDESTQGNGSNLVDDQQKHSSALKKKLESGLVLLENYLKVGDGSARRSLQGLDPDIGSRLVIEDGADITIGSFNRLSLGDVAHIMCIFAMLLMAKRLLVSRLAQSNWLRQRGLRPKDRERVDECIWRLIFYSFSSMWLIYTCFIKHNSLLLFSGSFVQYSFEVDWWSYTICMIETAFYLHATYALVWEDVWRRDSPMMLVHHLAAIFSVFGVYATRLTQIGLASVVLRDICDVLLEATKLLKCFQIQHGRRIDSLGLAIKFFLTIFTLAFAINQLYYYPLFCLYHGLNVIKVYHLQTPVMVGIVTCSLVFLLLDCIWFLLILRLLYYIVLSGGKLKDIREYDDDDEEEEEEEKEGATNGDLKDYKSNSITNHKSNGKTKSD